MAFATELVRTETVDGVRLDGILQCAPKADRRPATLDALVLLSGVGSNFYGSSLIEHLAHVSCAEGIVALRVNTRGHDGISTASTTSGGKLQGAAYEIVDDCRHDIWAWVQFLVEQGYQRIGLLGHSLGAVKVLYAQAHDWHVNVSRVIAVSPPRLAYSSFLSGPQADAFRQSLTQAECHVDEGEPDTLFSVSCPIPQVVSAASYLDKYGSAERYNILQFAHRVGCAVVFTFGEDELRGEHVAFHNIVSDIESLRWERRPQVHVIPAADHFYTGQISVLGDRVRDEICLA